jgi:hypothetical protein
MNVDSFRCPRSTALFYEVWLQVIYFHFLMFFWLKDEVVAYQVGLSFVEVLKERSALFTISSLKKQVNNLNID